MRILIVSILVLCGSAARAGDIVITPADSIQAAIGMASDGDTIFLEPGTYTQTFDFSGKAITIEGTAGAEATTIDGEGADWVVRFESGEDAGSILRGVRVTQTTMGNSDFGGVRIFSASPRLESCHVQDIQESAVSVLGNSVLTLDGCLVSDNSTMGNGAGVFIGPGAAIHATGCEFRDNEAGIGGAILGSSDAGSSVIEECLFDHNCSSLDGGAVLYLTDLQLQIIDCTFTHNETGIGGAAIVASGDGVVSVSGCVFLDNIGGAGGAITSESVSLQVSRCLFARNTSPFATAIGTTINPAFMEIVHCTFADNPMGQAAILLQNAASEVTLENCIVRAETPFSGTVTATYSDIEGGFPGVGNIDEDPQFVDAPGGDYSLSAGSPCIDAGNPMSPLDPDGTIADMGAFPFDQSASEFQRGDGNGDGSYDIADGITLLSFLFQSGSTPPCEDAADFDDDGAIGLPDAQASLLYVLTGGTPPAAPFPGCGEDATPSMLDCETSTAGCP